MFYERFGFFCISIKNHLTGHQRFRIFKDKIYTIMNVSLTTPALLFPAISLLLLAYTNRFLTIAGLIRNLYKVYMETPNENIKAQIANLKRRVILIRNMQIFGILSLFLCVLSMFLIYEELQFYGSLIFGISLVLLMISLVLSIIEIQISVKALNLQLEDMEK